jgi:hypothetical protein
MYIYINIYAYIYIGNEKTVKVFEKAWNKYQKMDLQDKKNPGKDQNHVLEGMRIGMYIYMYMYECVYVYICLLCMYRYVCIYIYMCIYIRIKITCSRV